MSDLIGKELGSYRILEQVGVGGMATVYKAYHATMDRYVAVKVLPEQMGRDPNFRQRFEREAKVIAKLEHAHILPVYDYGEDEERLYLVMRYVEAGTLKDRMAGGPMELAEISRVLDQVSGALAYGHSLGVVHRDVKPANVLLDTQGDCYLTDFGLAKMLEASVQLTATGVGLGTPAYMSPEQGQGVKVDARSDIYSTGVVLYEMVTGQVPYQAETPLAVVLKHITAPLPLPSEVKPDIYPAVERVILKALAKNPDDRYASANEMAKAFQRAVIEAGASPAVAIPPPQETPEPLADVVTLPLDVAPALPGKLPAAEIVTPVEEAEVRPRRKVPWWAFVAGGGAMLVVVLAIVLFATGAFSGAEDATPLPTEALAAVEGPTPLPTTTWPAPRPTVPHVVAGTGTFADSGQRLGSANSHAVVLGDLDGDSDLDAVVGNENEGAKVWLNAGGAQAGGQGSFSESGQTLSVGETNIYAVALGDLDGDGDLDAFLGNFAGANQVWWNNGAGRYINSGQSLGDSETTSVRLGDLDGDGDLDAFVGNGVSAGQANRVWLNDGTGELIDSGQELGDLTAREVALEDLDGDGDLDAFVASSDLSKVWFNDGGDQGGTPGLFKDSGQGIGPADHVAMVLGDLDDDGDVDALLGVAGPQGEPNQVWLNDGSGYYIDSGQSLGSGASEGVALGDVDADGDLDAFVANWFEQPNKVWLNEGMGILIDSGQSLGALDSRIAALGDLDGDGDLDAFVGNKGPNEVWLNQSKGVEGPTPVPDRDGIFVDSGQSLAPTDAARSRIADAALGDLDGDGDLDIFDVGGGANRVWLNTGGAQGGTAGAFGDSGQSLGDWNSNAVALGDLDGDGDLDAFVGNSLSDHRVWQNDGTGNFSDSKQSLSDSNGWGVALGDLDGDGDLDAFDAGGDVNKVWLNNGGLQGGTPGTFSDSGQNLEGRDSVALALGDLDGDGDLDAFVGNWAGGEPDFVWLNDGRGTFTDSGQRLGPSNTIAVALGDVDGDGDLDALVANQGNEPNRLWLNDGSASFADSQQKLGDSDSWGVALGDVDGDGDLDAVVGNGVDVGGQANTVWLNSGGAQGGAPGTYTDSGERLGNARTRAVLLGDLDGDGDLDILAANEDQANRVWLNQAAGGEDGTTQPAYGVTLKWIYTAPTDIWHLDSWGDGLAAGDCTGDGVSDVVFGTKGGAVIVVSGTDGEELWSYQITSETEAAVNTDLADVDDDAVLDVIAAGKGDSSSQGRAIIATLDGNGTMKWEAWADFEEVADLAYGDVDGDGDTDVVASAGTYPWGGGQVIVFDGATGDRVWSSSLGSGHAQGVAARDLDGDGVMEVAVENYDNQLFLLDGRAGDVLWSQSKEYHGRDVVIDDVDDDDTYEIVSAVIPVAAYTASGHRIWFINQGGDLVSASDVNGDGQTEVIISSEFEGDLRVLKGSTGEELWSRGRSGIHALGDVDGDGVSDVVVATIRYYGIDPPYAVEAVDGSNNLLWHYSLQEIYNESGFGLATAELDGDPADEVLVANGTSLLALDTSSAAAGVAPVDEVRLVVERSGDIGVQDCDGCSFGSGKALWADSGECEHLFNADSVEMSRIATRCRLKLPLALLVGALTSMLQ